MAITSSQYIPNSWNIAPLDACVMGSQNIEIGNRKNRRISHTRNRGHRKSQAPNISDRNSAIQKTQTAKYRNADIPQSRRTDTPMYRKREAANSENIGIPEYRNISDQNREITKQEISKRGISIYQDSGTRISKHRRRGIHQYRTAFITRSRNIETQRPRYHQITKSRNTSTAETQKKEI